jgi:hypothetical protein
MMAMELDDITPARHGERMRGYIKSTHGSEALHRLTHEEVTSAHQKATAEMLDEIHLMLRTFLDLK